MVSRRKAVPRSLILLELQRLPGTAGEYPLPAKGRKGRFRPHAQWLRARPSAHDGGNHRELPAGGRNHPGTCSAAHLHGRSRRHPVSGPAPETERERQLRLLAGRLLTWPDPEGPAAADLTLGYPDELPPNLVDRTELRFLGSVVRRRAGELVGAEMIFEGPGAPEAVAAEYATILVGLGWERIEQPRPPGGGFQHRAMMGSTLLVDKRESAMVFLHAAAREDGGAELRVRYDPV